MPLKQIAAVDIPLASTSRPSKRNLAEAAYEKKWLQEPEQFNPERTVLSLDYHKKVLNKLQDVIGKKCVDLGMGYGLISKALAASGAEVTAVDIAPSLVQRLTGIENLHAEQHFIPYTSLPDNAFDWVIAANLIAELPEMEHRLFFSELARIVKPEGSILVSTPIDIDSEDALQRFLYLAQTELNIETFEVCHHRLYLRLLNWINGNWLLRQNWLLKALEKLSAFLFDEEGISYVLIIGKRRSLFD